MLQGDKIADILRSIQSIGEVAPEDDESIDFQYKIGNLGLQAWAFIFSASGIVLQIYCVNNGAPEHAEETLRLINKLNHKLPFGSYQSSDHGVVTYRAQCFAANIEQAEFSIRTALEWAENSLEEHMPAISAVSSGFTSAEAALILMDSKSLGDSSNETDGT